MSALKREQSATHAKHTENTNTANEHSNTLGGRVYCNAYGVKCMHRTHKTACIVHSACKMSKCKMYSKYVRPCAGGTAAVLTTE